MKSIVSDDPWQTGYEYELVSPIGADFHKDFCPELSPQEMLSLGVFGGCYFPPGLSEFPLEWFENARLRDQEDASANFFGILASQPYEVWKEKGWIHPQDPRGWFQWYCRYYLGRRTPEEDERQIKRWRAIRRHAAQVRKNCRPGDLNCRRRQRQALLQWAYDSRLI